MNEDLFREFSNINSWSNFASKIRKITSTLKDPIFRGQGNTFRSAGCSDFGWRLEPSLYRIPKASHPCFIECVKTILTECQDELVKTVDHPWGNDGNENRDLIIGLMRHLGFPTPVLDWTKNPFVAAYFAFDRIHKCPDGVSIFLFDQQAWLSNENYLTSRDLRILNLRVFNDNYFFPSTTIRIPVFSIS